LEPSCLVKKTNGVKYNRVTCQQQEHEPYDFTGGGHGPENKEVEEQVKKIYV
jgi:hypothetical protein